MRYLLLTLLLFTAIHSSAQNEDAKPADFFNEADSFLSTYVVNGHVDYKAICKQPKKLDRLLDMLSTLNLSEMSGDTEKAYLINAYNIFVIEGITDHYPIPSPTKIQEFFDQKKYNLGGKNVSLNQLEKEILYPSYRDARLHMALVCAAKSCPPLLDAAFRPSILNKQLDQVTRTAANNPDFIRVNKAKSQVALSKIFDWYKSDFTTNGTGIIEWINQYRSKPIASDLNIDYYKYDWSLNDAG